MRVIELRASNFRGLRAVEITPGDGPLVTVAGRNGQGKSSVLDAIWAALSGGHASRQIPAPVRQGERRAEVSVDLGSLQVTRTWTAGGKNTALKVVAADGRPMASPQDVLNELLGKLTFDPLAFTRLPEREQVRTLADLVDLPFDPDEIDRQRSELFARRTDVNREIKQAEGQLAITPEPEEGLPELELSLADLASEHAAATRAHDDHRQLARKAELLADEHHQLRETIARIERELEEARSREVTLAVQAVRASEAATEQLASLPDIEAITERMRDIENVNRAIRARDERTVLVDLVAERQAASAALTAEIDAIDERRSKALAAVEMPLPGLSFGAEGVTYRGVPLKSCSGAEQLRTAAAIAMAARPRVRVMRITDGSLLDEDGMEILRELANEHDFQVWVERVDSTGEVGIVIEDGAVAAVNA